MLMLPASSLATSIVVMSGASLTVSPVGSVNVCEPALRRSGRSTARYAAQLTAEVLTELNLAEAVEFECPLAAASDARDRET